MTISTTAHSKRWSKYTTPVNTTYNKMKTAELFQCTTFLCTTLFWQAQRGLYTEGCVYLKYLSGTFSVLNKWESKEKIRKKTERGKYDLNAYF